MKINFLLFLSLLCFSRSMAQCPTDLTVFGNQVDVNNFVSNYPNCENAHVLSFQTSGITDLSPLSYLKSIGHLILIDADNIYSLMAFNNTKILMSLYIEDSDGILNLDGVHFSDFQEYTWLHLKNNKILENIETLNDLKIGFEMLTIMDNPRLSQCSVSRVCESLLLENKNISIANNSEGCDNQEEVQLECQNMGLNDFEINKKIVLSPNPSSNYIELATSPEIIIDEVKIYTQLGRLMSINTKKNIDITHLDIGIYFVEISTNSGRITKKIVKQ